MSTAPTQIKYHGQLYKLAVTVGPRGGKIIGKTKSGKPIYAPSQDIVARGAHVVPTELSQAHMAQHADFTAADHHDAAALHTRHEARHRARAMKHLGQDHKDSIQRGYRHMDRASAHSHVAYLHQQKAQGK